MMTAWTKFRNAVARVPRRTRRQCRHHLRLCEHPGARLHRRRLRLQPRQFGQGRPAGRARLDRADAGEGRRHHSATATCRPRRTTISPPCSTGRKPRSTRVSATYTASGGSQVVVTASADVPTTFLRALGAAAMQNITVGGSSTAKWGSTRLRVALVLDNTGSMAEQRQDDRAQERDQEPADAAQERRHDQRRRLRLHHSVQQGRQCRLRQLQRQLDRLERLGRRQRKLAIRADLLEQLEAAAKADCSGSNVWVPKSYNTWNGCITDRDRTTTSWRPRHNPADAILPSRAGLDPVPGRAIQLLPGRDDGAELRLDQR